MKGTLLLLALLMTILAGEACTPFYEVFSKLISGNKKSLDSTLDKFGATNGEKEAFEKMQDCYNEEGSKGKAMDIQVMKSIVSSKDCRMFYSANMRKRILKELSNIPTTRKGPTR